MRLLFVCVGNSCRSQIAEAIANELGFEAASAGTEPANNVNSNAISVLQSKGISTKNLYPKSIDNVEWQSFDMVISMGCGVNCPMIKIDQDWELEDPVDKSLEVFEDCYMKIEDNLKKLMRLSLDKIYDENGGRWGI